MDECGSSLPLSSSLRRRLLLAFDLALLVSIGCVALSSLGKSQPSAVLIAAAAGQAPLAADAQPWNLGSRGGSRKLSTHASADDANALEGDQEESGGRAKSQDADSRKKRRQKRRQQRGKRRRNSGKDSEGTEDADAETPAAERRMERNAKSAALSAPAKEQCGVAVPSKCKDEPRRALVTLSVGNRPHMSVVRLALEAYARRAGAQLHVVDSYAHKALAGWNETFAQRAESSHFVKLPLLQYFLRKYDQVLFVDDDVLISPFAPNMFELVPCDKVGAVVEAYHVQGWHTMHARSFCELYGMRQSHPGVCAPKALKRQRIFNSGVLLLSKAHLQLLDGWDKGELKCKILCDQLYLNAMLKKQGVCLHDLGTAFNLPGTQVRKQLLSTGKEPQNDDLELRDSALAHACVAHLTVLPNKLASSHYLLSRALKSDDVLQCAGAREEVDRQAMLSKLPAMEYDLEQIWCENQGEHCRLLKPSEAKPGALALHKGGAPAASEGAAAVPTAEMPDEALQVVQRAAAKAWDKKTVILLFATGDFMDLAFNWAQASRLLGLHNFVLVAMDKKLGDILGRFKKPPGLLLPRVASGAVTISKLNVIGERQRFGLRVLERGFNVLFADLDAIFLKSPQPLLADGDIVGERIWGRPLSVVKKWGAAICTGFYFIRSNPNTINIFRHTHFLITRKRAKQPKWQASDQWAINHAIDEQVVDWEGSAPMRPISDMRTKYWDNSSQIGYTRNFRSKFVVLPHVAVARSCPILKHGANKPPASDHAEMRKWTLWQHLLKTSSVLHCFPPDSMPCGDLKHGEKGCDKSVIMGSAVHIHGEVVFDQKQGLWFMRDGWEKAVLHPANTDFFAWLKSQHNGMRPGMAPPPPSGPALPS